MDVQHDYELDTSIPAGDMSASYLPAFLDDFLVLARLRHRRPRTKKCKIHSPIILRANTDMPAAPRLTAPVHRPYKKCSSLPNMAKDRLR
jgi:hypothetical protein